MITRDTRRVAREFGISLDGPRALPIPTPDPAALRALRDLPANSIAAIVGPSGAGKGILLRALARSLPPRRLVTVPPDFALPRRPSRRAPAPAASPSVIDIVRRAMRRAGPTPTPASATRLLSRFGLAEARLFIAPAHALSTGQRARLALALAFLAAQRAPARRAAPPITIACDEFLSSLDPLTARLIAPAIANAVRARADSRARLIVATGCDSLARALAPDLLMRVGWGGRCSIAPPAPRRREPIRPRLRIERASYADYAALARFHYRAGRPATIVRVLRATARADSAPRERILAGALVVSMPTLNAPRAARAGLSPPNASRAAAARALNRRVRCISRVIVDPRFRALGVATALVRAYLRRPITRRTEAFTAMGPHCRFFQRAGMRPISLPPRASDARLLRALRAHAITDADLATPAKTWRRIARLPSTQRRAISRALCAWAQAAGRAQAPWRNAPPALLFARACASAHLSLTAYIHTRRPRALPTPNSRKASSHA